MPDKTLIVAGGETGQTQIREETAVSELKLPLDQWRALQRLRYLMLACCAGLFLAWSPWSFVLVGVAAIGLLAVNVGRDEAGWYWHLRPAKDKMAWVMRGFVIMVLLTVWGFLWDDALALAWPECLDLHLVRVPLRGIWHLHVAIRLLLTGLFAVPIWGYKDFEYRMRAEITDPSWSAPILPRIPDTGPAFPESVIRSEPAPPSPPQKPERVPCPVPTNWGGNHEMLPPPSIYKSGYRSVMAPSGNEVAVSDLTTFIRMAPTIGVSSRTWKARGWQHEHWQDVMDIWKLFGVVGKREERKESELLVKDFTMAMKRLSDWLNTIPTPPED